MIDKLYQQKQATLQACEYINIILAKAQCYTHVKHQKHLKQYPGFGYLLDLKHELMLELICLAVRIGGERERSAQQAKIVKIQ